MNDLSIQDPIKLNPIPGKRIAYSVHWKVRGQAFNKWSLTTDSLEEAIRCINALKKETWRHAYGFKLFKIEFDISKLDYTKL